MKLMRFTVALAISCALALIGFAGLEAQRRGGPPSEGLSFRFLGPVVGNRVARRSRACPAIRRSTTPAPRRAASGKRPTAASAGCRCPTACRSRRSARWRSRRPIPNIVWAGTGEAWAIRDSDVIGDGIYKSIDAGTDLDAHRPRRDRPHRPHPRPSHQSRHRLRLRDRTHHRTAAGARRVPRPTDGGAALGSRAVRRREHRLLGLSMDAKNPRTSVRRHVAGRDASVGHAERRARQRHLRVARRRHDLDAIEASGGSAASRRSARSMSRSRRPIRIASTRVDSDARIRDRSGDRTTAASNWRVVNWSRALIGRAGYYIHIARLAGERRRSVSSRTARSGNRSTAAARSRSGSWGGDNHDIWWDPKDADRFVITHDAGLTITTQHARSTQRVTLPIGQMYHVDRRQPGAVLRLLATCRTTARCAVRRSRPENAGAGYNGSGNRWDHGSRRLRVGPHRSRSRGSEHRLVHLLRQQGDALRPPQRTIARSVAPWMITLDAPPTDSKLPLPLDARRSPSIRSITTTCYYGCNVIFHDHQRRPELASRPARDLSTQDPSKIMPSRRHRRRQPRAVRAGSRSSRSRRRKSRRALIWAGTNDGKVWSRATAARSGTTCQQEHHRHAGLGCGVEDRAVALRRRHARTSPSTRT